MRNAQKPAKTTARVRVDDRERSEAGLATVPAMKCHYLLTASLDVWTHTILAPMAEALVAAIQEGKLADVRKALRAKPKAGVLARAAVMCAGRAWQPGLELLHRHGADLNGVWRGYRPLHALIQERPHGETKPTPERLVCLEWLLANGADAEQTGAWPPARAIIVAAFMGEPEFVKRLRGASKIDGFAGAAMGDRKLVEKALQANSDLARERDHGGLTALQCACGGRMPRGEYRAIAALLMDAGADPRARTKSWAHELDASYYANGSKDPELFELVLKGGCEPQEALGHAVWGKHFALAEIALRYGASVDEAIHEGKPLLNNLIRWGQMQQALWLIERGASPNVADCEGWTAVHQAASRGNARMFDAVLKAGGDTGRRDKQGRRPLDLANAKLQALAAGR